MQATLRDTPAWPLPGLWTRSGRRVHWQGRRADDGQARTRPVPTHSVYAQRGIGPHRAPTVPFQPHGDEGFRERVQSQTLERLPSGGLPFELLLQCSDPCFGSGAGFVLVPEGGFGSGAGFALVPECGNVPSGGRVVPSQTALLPAQDQVQNLAVSLQDPVLQ